MPQCHNASDHEYAVNQLWSRYISTHIYALQSINILDRVCTLDILLRRFF